jgi:hypothetical protein
MIREEDDTSLLITEINGCLSLASRRFVSF